MDNKIIKFFGESYTDAQLLQAHHYSDRRGIPIGMDGSDRATGGSFLAVPLGALYECNFVGRGRTRQNAARDLERQVLREFRKIGKAIGYEVE